MASSTDGYRIAGSLASNVGRAPKTAPRGRICAVDACDTVLSRYNLDDRCRTHKTPRYPVLRGVPTR
jgi:hypothetical protein